MSSELSRTYSRVRRGPRGIICTIGSGVAPYTRRGVLYILRSTVFTKIISDDVQSVENIRWSGVARTSGVLYGILVHGSSALD